MTSWMASLGGSRSRTLSAVEMRSAPAGGVNSRTPPLAGSAECTRLGRELGLGLELGLELGVEVALQLGQELGLGLGLELGLELGLG
jgi:hypothetical protein